MILSNTNVCSNQQEIFEARYQKIVQEPTVCSVAHHPVDKTQRNGLTASPSSSSQSSSEEENASEVVANQLANLEEQVGMTFDYTRGFKHTKKKRTNITFFMVFKNDIHLL